MIDVEQAAMLLACGAVQAVAMVRETPVKVTSPREVWGFQSDSSKKFWREQATILLFALDQEKH